MQEKDFASQPLLQWFIEEQVEEEKSAGEIVDTLKMIKEDATALLMLDRELGQRLPPSEAEGEQAE
jgi:ferritin